MSALPASADFLEKIEAHAWRDNQRAAPAAVRERFGLAVHEVDGALVMLASRGPLGMNRVVNLGGHIESSPHTVPRLIELYHAAGVAQFLTLWSPRRSPRIRADLDARGATVRSRMAKLYRRPDADGVSMTTLSIVIIGAEDAESYGRAVATGHGDPPELAAAHSATVGRASWRHYLALDGDRPVAGASLFWNAGVAWCGFGATVPEARGRGAHGALLARRVSDAALLGCEWVVCETAEDRPDRPNPAYRNMRRAGFELAYHRDVLLLNV